MHPLPPISHPPITKQYQSHPLFNPFLHPYNTLHTLPSFPFPIIILPTIKNLPIQNPTHIPKQTINSPTITIIIIPIIYTLLPIIPTLTIPH
ncbi:branched-chain amino acid transport system II carrier protein, partial [Staphylococcus aureus]|uniref:branched-chain amino acid transport system II carrier protein n=1 Tax=Staphylococcus aureus TaxID=1280 RepID=UPI0037D9966A